MDRRIWEEWAIARKKGERVAMATIVATRGSTPRKAGTGMLVFSDGKIIGSVGGGCAEAEVKARALRVLDGERGGVFRVSMTGDTVLDEGMVCGGTMDVFVI